MDMVAGFDKHLKECDQLINDIEDGPAMRAALKQLTDAFDLRPTHALTPSFIDAVEKAYRMGVIATNPQSIRTT